MEDGGSLNSISGINNAGSADSFKLKLTAIPPHPSQSVLQRGGDIKVDIKNLHLNSEQLSNISSIYDSANHFHHLFEESNQSQ
ncbi:hypothetical protein M422DRAFT_252060 [Sphaerobolus stellatus SS14]|uniref:Uncharacterized protein n=1 Tax=Sphaerobolus stellatus (strain SS14) TaxID=990650 RepID=A0A0C9VZE7_SPHS4|nr:hypothetical protein M422DRAFT_252060 [Sphaerobolus stellatus SS14]